MYSLVKVLIYNLSLAVSLGVKCSKELNLNPKDTAEFILEIWYKLGIIVRNNWLRGAIESVNIINIEAGYVLYSYGLKIKEGDGLLV
jgi:hypothetical protein